MAKIQKIVATLEKLHVKRAALDKQIASAEKALIAEALSAAKPASPARKTAAKKPAVKKTGPKKAAKPRK